MFYPIVLFSNKYETFEKLVVFSEDNLFVLFSSLLAIACTVVHKVAFSIFFFF